MSRFSFFENNSSTNEIWYGMCTVIREDACSRMAYFIRHTALCRMYGIVAYVRHNNHAGSPVLGIPALPH